MNKNSKLIVWPYLLFQAFFQLLLWIPIFYQFQKQIGLGDIEIFKIQSWYYLIFVFFEIPTGYFSDRFGHKNCMRTGAFILVGSNLIPVFSPDFLGMSAHFATIALARALLSGAASAYLYEYLSSHDQVDLYKKTEGQARSLTLVARIIGWSLVGPMMSFHLNLPYILTSFFTFLAFIVSFFLPELPVVQTQKSQKFIKDLSNIPIIIKKSPTLLLLMAHGIGLFLLARICQVNLFQPLLLLKEFPIASFGIMMATMSIFEAFGASLSYRLQKHLNDLKALYLMSSTLCISFLFLIYGNQIAVGFGFILFSFATGVAFPLQKQLINEAITDTEYRATILSVESMINRTVAAFVISFVGGFVQRGQLLDYLLYSAIGCGIFITSIYILLKSNLKYKTINS